MNFCEVKINGEIVQDVKTADDGYVFKDKSEYRFDTIEEAVSLCSNAVMFGSKPTESTITITYTNKNKEADEEVGELPFK